MTIAKSILSESAMCCYWKSSRKEDTRLSTIWTLIEDTVYYIFSYIYWIFFGSRRVRKTIKRKYIEMDIFWWSRETIWYLRFMEYYFYFGSHRIVWDGSLNINSILYLSANWPCPCLILSKFNFNHRQLISSSTFYSTSSYAISITQGCHFIVADAPEYFFHIFDMLAERWKQGPYSLKLFTEM